MNNFYTLTGGPGTGKSTLIVELAQRGYYCVEEAARQIIKEQMACSRHALPWADVAQFKEVMLYRMIDDYKRALSRSRGIVFFDRDLLDLVAYDRFTGHESSSELCQALETYRFNRKAFIAPPWEAVYCNDSERQQSYNESVVIYRNIVETYQLHNRQLIELPRLSVEERADFVIAQVSEDRRLSEADRTSRNAQLLLREPHREE